MKYLPLLLFLFASCVMPSDIEDLRRAQGSFEAAVLGDLQDLERGVITRGEYDARVALAEAQRADELEAIQDRVEARTEAVATGVPLTGHPLIDLALQGGATAALAAFGVNKYRNSKREKRGEPIA